jgi:hypothetical protein
MSDRDRRRQDDRARSPSRERIVATGGRCPECAGPMVRQSAETGLAWICTAASCGETLAERSPLGRSRALGVSERRLRPGRAPRA